MACTQCWLEVHVVWSRLREERWLVWGREKELKSKGGREGARKKKEEKPSQEHSEVVEKKLCTDTGGTEEKERVSPGLLQKPPKCLPCVPFCGFSIQKTGDPFKHKSDQVTLLL